MGNESSQEVRYGEKLENDVIVKWEKTADDNSNSVPGRDGHCACSVGNTLYVFGGIVPQRNQQSDNIESNEILAFDLDKQKWSQIDAKGDVPSPRSGATMASVGKKLYLFGGLSRDAGWFDTVHIFDTETNMWHLIEPKGKCPSARDKVASAVIGKLIYIFGGFGPQGMEMDELDESDEDEEVPEDQEAAQFGWFNDLFIYDTETDTFSSPMQMNLGCPTPRAAHGMCSVDNYLVIFGGRDAEGRKNDLHIFNTDTRKWITDLVVHGRQPEPRSFHTVTAVRDRVVIIGGRGVSDQHFQDFHIFDTAKQLWLQPKLEGSIPAARSVHTTTVVGDKLVIFGGSAEYNQETMQCSLYYNDVCLADTANILTGSAHLPPGVVASGSSVEQSSSSCHVSDSTKRPLGSECVSSSDSQQRKADENTGSPSKRHKKQDSDPRV